MPLAALHAEPGTFVVLRHYDRKAGSMVHTVVDVYGLACAVPKSLGISLEDWVCVCMTRGTDFVERAVYGAPAWSPYVRSCASYLRQAGGAQLMQKDGLDASVAYRMLHSAAVGKRAKVTADQAYFARLFWNLAYWKLAPLGQGAQVDHMDGRFGWFVTVEGSIATKATPLKGGIITMTGLS